MPVRLSSNGSTRNLCSHAGGYTHMAAEKVTTMRQRIRIRFKRFVALVRLPTVPVEHRLQRLAWGRLEIRSQRIRHRDERCLHHLMVGDAEHFRRLLLEEEMKARQAGSQTPRPRGQHKAPGGRHNRAPGASLSNN